MFCNRCGSVLGPGAQYCTQCGQTVAAAGAPAGVAATAPSIQAPAAGGRVIRNRNILGVLWLVVGAIGLVGALVLFILASTRPWDNPYSSSGPTFLAPMFFAIAMFLVIFSVLQVVAAVGLLQTQRWARLLLIILAIVLLLDIPFGTALGIYTLWVLMPDTSDTEYRQLAAARARA
ncbi:MAG: zinc ribbon domain-containing protein [Terriglobales bacterium]